MINYLCLCLLSPLICYSLLCGRMWLFLFITSQHIYTKRFWLMPRITIFALVFNNNQKNGVEPVFNSYWPSLAQSWIQARSSPSRWPACRSGTPRRLTRPARALASHLQTGTEGCDDTNIKSPIPRIHDYLENHKEEKNINLLQYASSGHFSGTH